MSSSPKSPERTVLVDLSVHRERTRLRGTRRRIDLALQQVRDTLSRMHATQVLFTRHGARVAKDLLDAQLHLLKAGTLVDRTDAGASSSGTLDPAELEQVLVDVDALIERAAKVCRRHRAYVESEREQG